MKQLVPYIVCIVATLLIVWTLKPFEGAVDVSSYEKKINALEKKVDSLHADNNLLVTEADSLGLELDRFSKKIVKLTTRINVIKYETEQKLNAVDNLRDDELERFFTDRYRHHKDTIK